MIVSLHWLHYRTGLSHELRPTIGIQRSHDTFKRFIDEALEEFISLWEHLLDEFCSTFELDAITVEISDVHQMRDMRVHMAISTSAEGHLPRASGSDDR